MSRLITLEEGKPLAESRGEVAYAASFVEWFAEEAKRIRGDVFDAPEPSRRIVVLKEPVGVCVAITPWKLPAAMITRKAAPALAAGCTMLVKPAEQTPLTALALAELAQRAAVTPPWCASSTRPMPSGWPTTPSSGWPPTCSPAIPSARSYREEHMPAYTRTEARAWAREKLVGAVNCTIPSFTGDLERINEPAIRHDARLAVQHGFLGTLGVSEVAITLPEYLEFLRIIRAEAGADFVVCHHGSWSTLEHNIAAVRGAEEAGADLMLLSYPPNFYPESEQEIYDYTKAVCDATNLAVVLFPMYLWGFSPRIHPSDIPVRLIRRLLDACPNIAVIKAEGGFPFTQGIVDCYRHFGDEVVISVPIEAELFQLSPLMPIQLSATSDHEYFGPMIPRAMELLRDGKYDEASELFWQLHPARKAKGSLAASMHGGAFINRQMWKFQGWLQGYNGGPLRMPTQRIHDTQMNVLRKGLVDAGLEPSMDPYREFFIGRNPA